jgi:hypothetical protein
MSRVGCLKVSADSGRSSLNSVGTMRSNWIDDWIFEKPDSGRISIKVKKNRVKSRAAVRVEVVQSWVFEGEPGQA